MDPVIDPTISSHKPAAPQGHHEKAQKLVRHLEEGKNTVPEHPEPLVCKPQKVESWRVFKIMSEFVEGFELLKKYGLAATFFGTARESFGGETYKDAEALAGKLAKIGFAVITGGNDGIMRSANKGAFEAGGASVGINIMLPNETQRNDYLTDFVVFDHFFTRKVMLAFAAEVYIVFPGGFGTLDELFEILTLVQTKKIRKVPIVLYDKDYWTPIITFFKEHLLDRHHAIDPEDMELFVLVDSVDEAFEYIQKNVAC